MVERNTHLLTWLEGGYWSCRYGSQAWAEGYLHNARDVIVDQDARIAQLERDLAEARDNATAWHRQCETVATILELPEPDGISHAEAVRTKFERLRAELAEARAINANLMGDDEDKPRYTTKRLKQEIAKAVAAAEAERNRLAADLKRTTKERDKERKHVARLMRDLESARKRAERGEALASLDLTLVETALAHASFALDGVTAEDDEDMGKDGGSATCQATKKTVDRALSKVRSSLQHGEQGE